MSTVELRAAHGAMAVGGEGGRGRGAHAESAKAADQRPSSRLTPSSSPIFTRPALCVPRTLKVRTPAHTKHLGWYLEFEFRVTRQCEGVSGTPFARPSASLPRTEPPAPHCQHIAQGTPPSNSARTVTSFRLHRRARALPAEAKEALSAEGPVCRGEGGHCPMWPSCSWCVPAGGGDAVSQQPELPPVGGIKETINPRLSTYTSSLWWH